MIRYLIIVFLLATLISCKKENPGEKDEFNKDDNPNIADDEYGEAIYFEVDPNKNSFHLSSDDLDDAKTVFGRFCFYVDGGFHSVDEGCIIGEKITENKWEVSFSLRINSTWEPITVMVSEEFILE